MVVVTLYHTLGCHLCDLAQSLLVPFADAQQISLQRVDIADQDDLVERYGVRIPVVRREDNERELGWPFGTEDIDAFIRGAAGEK